MSDFFTYNDGGRAEAGYKGKTGDCGVRAIAIATGKPYQDVYDMVKAFGGAERPRRDGKRNSHPRTGVWMPTMKAIMEHLGWQWTPTMSIGSGCKVHVRPDELPSGRLILRLTRHYAAFIDGELHDTHDSSRDGSRCVYGYWSRD